MSSVITVRTRVYKPLPISLYIRLVCDSTFEVKHSLVRTDCDLQLELAWPYFGSIWHLDESVVVVPLTFI